MTETLGSLLPGALGTLQGLAVSTAFVLLLFVGFCILFNLPKLRRRGRGSRIVHSLDEALGHRFQYMSSDTPRGRTDQLNTPELVEARGRNSK